jgi:hypothetical protein
MTTIAGVFSRLAEPVPADVKVRLRCALGDPLNNSTSAFDRGSCFLAHLDVGSFGRTAIMETAEGLTVIVGDPIVQGPETRRYPDRRDDADFLHRALLSGDAMAALATTTGTFAGAHLPKGDDQLILFTDKFGVRQLFATVTDRWVYFSTRLATLRELPDAPKTLDAGALLEEATLHYAVGRKSPFRETCRLAAGEVFSVKGNVASSDQYWSLTSIPASTEPLDEQVRTAHRLFQQAVRARMSGPCETSYLSGGLDSRSIVATLVGEGATVNTVNFAPDGTQDRVFADLLAERLGTHHIQIPFSAVSGQDRTLGAIGYLRSTLKDPPKILWGGNGGSVGFGFVYATDEIVQRMRAGDYDGAIDAYLDDQGGTVTRRPYRRKVYEAYAEQPRQSIKSEFERLAVDDPARTFYFFLMENDQRRSLHRYYELIDKHRVEFALPFFDANFLAYVASLNPTDLLYHRFYNRWLSMLPDAASTTPWQAYPGHEPCPIEPPPGLGYQFDTSFSRAYSRAVRRKRLGTMWKMVRSAAFPSHCVSRLDVLLGGLLQFLGKSEYAYTVDTAELFFNNNAKP